MDILLPSGEIEGSVYLQVQTARSLYNTLLEQAISKAQDDRSYTPVAVASKCVSQLLDLASFMLMMPTETPIEENFSKAAGYCQATQLMLLSITQYLNNDSENGGFSAQLAVQQLREIGML